MSTPISVPSVYLKQAFPTKGIVVNAIDKAVANNLSAEIPCIGFNGLLVEATLANRAFSQGGTNPSVDLTARGTSTSAADPATDLTEVTDTKLKVALDGANAIEATFDFTGCSTSAMVVDALNDGFAVTEGLEEVVASFVNNLYVITSPTYGSGSSVVITDSDSSNVADNLKLGTSNGGIEVAGSDDKFKIAVDGQTAKTITLDCEGLTSGALIAAEMQSKIRAEGGVFADVSVSFVGTGADAYYYILSGTPGSTSIITVTNADSANVADNLKIGADNGGTEDSNGGSFNVSVEGALTSGGAVQPLKDVNNNTMETGTITSSITKVFVGVPDAIKIKATEVADGSQVIVNVQPIRFSNEG